MQLYSASGPNPRTVRIFLAEKGIEVPLVPVDLVGGENRQADHLERNPAGQLPTLELDDGTHLSEVTAICEYLEERYPEPALIGRTPEERAQTRMWARRIDLNIVEPLASSLRYGEFLALFENRIRCIPHAADDLKAIVSERLVWLDELIEGRDFIAGDRFTLADILLWSFLDLAGMVGRPLDAKLGNLQAWFERVAARPSVQATTP